MFTLVVPAHLPLLKRHLKRGTLSIKDLHRETYAISRVPAVAAAAAAPLMLVLHPHIQHQTSLTSSAESLAAWKNVKNHSVSVSCPYLVFYQNCAKLCVCVGLFAKK